MPLPTVFVLELTEYDGPNSNTKMTLAECLKNWKLNNIDREALLKLCGGSIVSYDPMWWYYDGYYMIPGENADTDTICCLPPEAYSKIRDYGLQYFKNRAPGDVIIEYLRLPTDVTILDKDGSQLTNTQESPYLLAISDDAFEEPEIRVIEQRVFTVKDYPSLA